MTIAVAPVAGSPWLAVAAIAAALLGMLALLGAVAPRLHPEIPRKVAHVALGASALLHPWLFDEAWPVVVLGLLTLLVLAALRVVVPLRARLGAVVHGVRRVGEGDLWFPVSATLLFVATAGDPLLHAIPMLTLTAADAAAALVGVRWGRRRFATADGWKSVEGSAAFFAVAFLAAAVPLLLVDGRGAAHALLVAGGFALLLTPVELAAWRGLDNLLVPLGGLVVLRLLLPLDVPVLALLAFCAALPFGLAGTLRAAAIALDPRHRATRHGAARALRRIAVLAGER